MVMNPEIPEKERHYWATVPVNSDGIDDVEYMREGTQNILEYIIPESEFNTMWDGGIIDIINQKCGLILDVYESDEIPLSKCAKVLDILRETGFGNGIFATAITQALNYGTFVECGFL